MQGWYPEAFTREMGCTEAELRMWLPAAVGDRALVFGDARAEVPLGDGRFTLAWAELPRRRIALMNLPRLEVRFAFAGVTEAERQAFMKRFDTYMQRGGG